MGQSQEKSLRHGWGGDKKKRAKALRRKKRDRRERKTHPYRESKFGQGSEGLTDLDQELLEEMSQ